MVSLTYRFGRDPDAPLSSDAPELAIRIYHDARVAEAHSLGQLSLVSRGGSPIVAEDLRSRWERNMMLNKWLEYCIDRGHRFGADQAA
jgi:hypothetical protein